MSASSLHAALRTRGVTLRLPETIAFGNDVDPSRFAAGTVIHPGCRLYGATSSAGPGCIVGEEGPVTLRDCQLGARVRLRGGSFERATLLDDVEAGSCAHIRPGTLLEEHVAFGHAVGLKQTVLLPFVATGSLINFCDCLMAGGTGADDHSEIGSSYIHFNFTPHQDKATASLLGDVPRGVWLDQRPIFLGGQGGLVGPCRIAYGTVLAAGQVCRSDVLEPDTLVCRGGGSALPDRPYDPRLMGRIEHRLASNLLYIGNLLALDAWWRHARARFAREPWQVCLHAGALARLQEAFDERLKRLAHFAAKVNASLQAATAAGLDCREAPFPSQKLFVATWPRLQRALQARVAARAERIPGGAAAAILAAADGTYLDWVRARSRAEKAVLTDWLQAEVNACEALSNGDGGT